MKVGCASIFVVVCLALAGAAPSQSSLQANEAPAPDAAAAFEELKGLAGRWDSRSTVGWEADMDYRVLARGSAILVTSEFKDAPGRGMATVFFLDRGRLKLTHYCEARNQPTLVATSITADGIVFEFESGTGMVSRDTGHMDKVVMKFRDNDHFSEQWSWYQNGQQRLFEEIEYRRAGTR